MNVLILYLLGAIGDCGNVGRDLTQFGALLLEALIWRSLVDEAPAMVLSRRTHLPNELLDGLADGISAKIELCGDPLCLICQSHAAFCVCVESSCEVDLLLGLRAGGRGFMEDNGTAERKSR